ncbi:MAG: hypothetical protein ABSB29_06850 [Nitrososphaerales archaeon]
MENEPGTRFADVDEIVVVLDRVVVEVIVVVTVVEVVDVEEDFNSVVEVVDVEVGEWNAELFVTIRLSKAELQLYVPTPTYPDLKVGSLTMRVCLLFQIALMVSPLAITVMLKVPVGLI